MDAGLKVHVNISVFDWSTEAGHGRKENPVISEWLYGLQV